MQLIIGLVVLFWVISKIGWGGLLFVIVSLIVVAIISAVIKTNRDSLPPPEAKPQSARREAIPKAVQREVWTRDGAVVLSAGQRKSSATTTSFRSCVAEAIPSEIFNCSVNGAICRKAIAFEQHLWGQPYAGS